MDLITTKPVLVTGANGFLGAHVVSQLLARGYSVRGIVRPRKEGASEDAPRPSAADFMSASSAPGSIKGSSNLYAPYSRISGAPEKLEFIEADLNSDDNWEAALSEVEYVIHTAGPVNLYSDNPQLDFMQPMVEGTRRLLELCQKSHAVKKFVYISCISTLCEDFDSIKDYNENDWNTTSTLTRYPAAFSKTMAEKLVLSFASQIGCRFSVTSLVPGILWGPPVHGRRLSFSHKFLTAWLSGDAIAIINVNYNISDVRDVARACLLSIEQPRVTGRYCLCNDPMSLSEVLQIVHENFIDLKVPTRKLRDFPLRLAHTYEKSDKGEFVRFNLGKIANVNCNRAREVGMLLRPQVQTILDTTRYCLENDLLKKNKGGFNCVIS